MIQFAYEMPHNFDLSFANQQDLILSSLEPITYECF